MLVRTLMSTGVEVRKLAPMFWNRQYPRTPLPWLPELNPSAETSVGESVESAKSNSPMRSPCAVFVPATPVNTTFRVALSVSPTPSVTGVVAFGLK